MHDLRFLSAFLFLLEIAGCIHNLHQPPSVSLFSTLCSLPLSAPSISSSLSPGNLAFAALLISILQNVQMPPKIIHLPALWCHFTCTQTTPSTFCAASQTKRDGGGVCECVCVCVCVWRGGPYFTHGATLVRCFPTSSSPQLHHQSLQPKVSDTVMAIDGVFLPSQGFKWTHNIHALDAKTEHIIFTLFEG